MKIEELWSLAWRHLTRAAVDKKHDFNTPTLSTIHQYPTGDGATRFAPRSRTVVLRKANREAGTLHAYTDARSHKMTDLDASGGLTSWCFWDKRSHLQFSAMGLTTYAPRAEARQRYLEMPKHARKAYATIAFPGGPSGEPTDGLPINWNELTIEDTDVMADNFVMLTTTLLSVDILRLSREGHLRMTGKRPDASRDWSLNWVIP